MNAYCERGHDREAMDYWYGQQVYVCPVCRHMVTSQEAQDALPVEYRVTGPVASVLRSMLDAEPQLVCSASRDWPRVAVEFTRPSQAAA